MISKGSYLRTKARKSSYGFWTELGRCSHKNDVQGMEQSYVKNEEEN